MSKFKKIAIVGNACSGKTLLARSFSKRYSLPLTHVDSIQFLSGMQIRPHQESISALRAIEENETWIIDGYGPLDMILNRFEIADLIILLDAPVWRNYLWAVKRQLFSLCSKRKELPEGCVEFNWRQTERLFNSIRKANALMRPELLRILDQPNLKTKTMIVRGLRDYRKLLDEGLPADLP